MRSRLAAATSRAVTSTAGRLPASSSSRCATDRAARLRSVRISTSARFSSGSGQAGRPLDGVAVGGDGQLVLALALADAAERGVQRRRRRPRSTRRGRVGRFRRVLDLPLLEHLQHGDPRLDQVSGAVLSRASIQRFASSSRSARISVIPRYISSLAGTAGFSGSRSSSGLQRLVEPPGGEQLPRELPAQRVVIGVGFEGFASSTSSGSSDRGSGVRGAAQPQGEPGSSISRSRPAANSRASVGSFRWACTLDSSSSKADLRVGLHGRGGVFERGVGATLAPQQLHGEGVGFESSGRSR